jgi:hypothetical protein
LNYSQASDKAGYQVLGLSGDNAGSSCTSVTINTNLTAQVMTQFLTPVSAFDCSAFTGGIWNANLYVYASGSDSEKHANVFIKVFKYNVSNTTTLLAQSSYYPISYVNSPKLLTINLNIPTTFTYATTDRLVIQVCAYNSNSGGPKPQTVYLYFEDTNNYSYAESTVPVQPWFDAQQNTYLGIGALAAKNGTGSTAVGYHALLQNTASNNTALGNVAGSNNTSGSNNTLLGNNAQTSTPTASNEVVLGNAGVTTLRCQQTSISGLSDARDKTDVRDLPPSLAFLNALRPVTFVWKTRDGSRAGDVDMGFLAQDVMAVEDQPYYRIVSREDPERYEMAPARLIPLLVKAVQDLSAHVSTLADCVTTLEKLKK